MIVRFIVGVSESDESRVWASWLRPLSLPLEVRPWPLADHFLPESPLDVEILATSLVVMRLDLFPPPVRASTYRLGLPDYPPIVVVPPVWGASCTDPLSPEEISKEDTDLWREVLAEVGHVIAELRAVDGRSVCVVGFRPDFVGLVTGRGLCNAQAFAVAFREFTVDLSAAGFAVRA